MLSKKIEKMLRSLYEQQKKERKWDLKNTILLLQTLGNPEKNLKIVHIAGTNGKGSTVSFISQILIEAGYSVGKYTSPHLVKINERIQVNNQPIEDQELEQYLAKIMAPINQTLFEKKDNKKDNKKRKNGKGKKKEEKGKGEKKDNKKDNPSFFEIMTCLAFQYFSDRKVDVVVLETGLGGRIDATNAASSIISVITNVGIEHTTHLGRTVKEIAKNKAGIIKKKQICVIPENETQIPCDAKKIIEEVCEKKDTLLVIAKKETGALSLQGAFQQYNAGIAKEVCHQLAQKGYFKITEQEIKRGLQNTVWPGRLELLKKNMIIDAAHNPHALSAVLPYLYSLKKKYHKTTLVFGVLKDKEYALMIKQIIHNFLDKTTDELIFTTPRSHRACPAKILQELANTLGWKRSRIIEGSRKLWKYLQKKSDESDDELIIVLGSIYLIGEIKEYDERMRIKKNQKNPSKRKRSL